MVKADNVLLEKTVFIFPTAGSTAVDGNPSLQIKEIKSQDNLIPADFIVMYPCHFLG